MAKRKFAKKFILNYLVMGGTGFPNLLITASSQAVLDIWFHWSGPMAVAAYFVGLSFSLTYTNLFSMWTKTEFAIFGRKYHFAHKEQEV